MIEGRQLKTDISGEISKFKAKKDPKTGGYSCREYFSPYIDESEKRQIYGSGKTAKEAITRAQVKATKWHAECKLPSNAETFDSFTDRFLKTRLETRIRGNTARSYRSMYEWYLSPQIGKMKVQALREYRQVVEIRSNIKRVRGGKAPLSADVINRVMTVLSMILDEGIREGLTNVNPCKLLQGLSKEKSKAPSDRTSIQETLHRCLTPDEIAILFEYAESSWYRDLFKFLLYTGCRIGEALALRWDHIHDGNVYVEFTASLDENGKQCINSAKTAAGIRKIPISEELAEVLQAQKERLQKIYRYKKDGLVFMNNKRQMACNKGVENALYKCIDRANKDGHDIERFSLHAFRVTFATTVANSGVSQETLKRWLGHTSLQMTDRYYRENDIHAVSMMNKVSQYRQELANAENVVQFRKAQ